MFQLRDLLTFLLLTVCVCQARTGGLQTGAQQKDMLQSWLVGLGAVVGFLFIVFIILIIKRVFFKKERDDIETFMEGFENKALDAEMAEETRMTNM